MATIWPSNGTAASVQALHNQVQTVDGDTITLPPGTFSYTSEVSITKGITIQGSTTVDPVNRTYNDQTIILDDEPTDWTPAFTIAPAAAKTVRLTGITFKKGARGVQWNGGMVACFGTNQATSKYRIWNCHFYGMQRNQCIYVGNACYGCVDHNLFTYDNTNPYTQSVLVRMPDWNGNTNGVGDASYTDYPWFGTDKFVFFEDNTFDNSSTLELMGNTDADFGGRMVFRNNRFYNVKVQNHGTEGRYRGTRCAEIYNNTFNFTNSTGALGGVRTGAYLFHDNQFTGTLGHGLDLNDLRLIFYFLGSMPNGFSGATGDNPWDYNVTESDGVTHIDGHAPYLFFSGTCAAGSNRTTIVETTNPGWTTNQWVGYTVKRISDSGISMILGNSSNTLNVSYVEGGYGNSPIWTQGNTYQIHKCLASLDQPGRGKGDLINGGYNNPPPTVNATTGTQSWAHQALEPCMAWNNFYEPGHVSFGFVVPGIYVPPETIFQSNRDFYNDSSLATASSVYGAALNGVAYTANYTYPHPLTITGPTTGKIISLTGNMAFGNVIVGNSPTSTLDVANTGDQTLTATAVSYPAGFSGPTGGFTIAPGQHRFITVTFTPTQAIVYSGNITVTSDATSGNNTILASGTGIIVTPPHAEIVLSSPTGLAFGNVDIGGISPTQILNVANPGDALLTVTLVSYPTGFSGPTTGFTVPAGNSVNITVTFTPLLPQLYSGVITVTSNATVGINTIACSGTGVPVTPQGPHGHRKQARDAFQF